MKKIILFSFLSMVLLVSCSFSYESKSGSNSSLTKTKATDGTCTVKVTKNDKSWECVESCEDIDSFATDCQNKEQ